MRRIPVLLVAVVAGWIVGRPETQMKILLGILLGCALCQAQAPPPLNPYLSPKDVARGERLFMGNCALCHGPRGDGGLGTKLAVPRLPRAPDDKALFNIIKNGIEGTEMPRAWRMLDREIWQLIAYVRTLGHTAPPATAGDPGRGEQLYRTKGNCVQCHTMAGHGGRMGTELTEVGARRSPAYLRTSLLDPEAAVPEKFLQVRVVTRDGRRITGIRLNESTFSIQVRDFTDGLHSFWKSELAELHKERGKSPMPSYRDVFTTAELDDLVAYLSSLRGGL